MLSHPGYSPDLAPSNYHLFESMAHFCVEEIWKTSNLWKWASPNSSHQKPETGTVAERWIKTIESDGLYFEEQFNFLSENIPNKILFKKRRYL